MSNRTIKVGLIGCGNIGTRAHLPACVHTSEVELVAVCDIIEERVRAAAERSGATAYTDYRKLLERQDVDVVIIALPNDLHAEVSIAAAEAGKHVLCEKPMALTLEEADAMIEAHKAAGTKLMVGQSTRYGAAFKRLLDMLHEGTFGRLVACWSTRLGRHQALRACRARMRPHPPRSRQVR